MGTSPEPSYPGAVIGELFFVVLAALLAWPYTAPGGHVNSPQLAEIRRRGTRSPIA